MRLKQEVEVNKNKKPNVMFVCYAMCVIDEWNIFSLLSSLLVGKYLTHVRVEF